MKECTIITDSMSLHSAIRANDWRDPDPHLKEIKNILYRSDSKISFMWIPSHIEIPGNDRADDLANKGTLMDQEAVAVTHKIVKAKIKSRKWTNGHERANNIYGSSRCPKFEVESKWPKDVQRYYQQLRTDHCKLLKHYRYVIETEEDPTCERCGEGDETLEHILCRCPGMASYRRSHFEGDVTDPERCRQFLSKRFSELVTLKEGGPRSGSGRTGSTCK